MEDLEYKTFEMKADDNGQLSAVFSTFGVVDHDGDVVEASAFTNGQSVVMVWSHDWTDPVGKGVVQVTDSEAVFNGRFFMDTARGQEAYKTVKAVGDLQEYSWGFRVLDAVWEQRDEEHVRIIKRAELFEVSPVLKGAGIGTRTLALKGRSLANELETVLAAVNSLGERLRSVKGLREKEGRTLSIEYQQKLDQIAKALRQQADQVDLLTADRKEAQLLLNQFLYEEARRLGAFGD